GLETRVKWPDDILVGGRKIGGMKIEAQLGPGEIASAVVTGRLNINVPEDSFPDAIRDRSTSVLMETGSEMALPEALNAVLGGIEERYESDDVSRMMQAYLERCETIGKRVKALLLPKGEVAGVATGVDPFGSLQIQVGGRTVPVVIDTLKKLEQA
ncbi:MAG: biotin--[acetyl-CoA-carboxylase] ligase, partial [Actinomycetota bacterium]